MDKDKLMLKGIGNDEKFNKINLEKSEKFLDNLQDFVIELGLAEIEEAYIYEGKYYDRNTYYNLFDQGNPSNNWEVTKSKIEDFNQCFTRYNNKDLELLIIFFQDKISLVFYCNQKTRQKVIEALSKLVQF